MALARKFLSAAAQGRFALWLLLHLPIPIAIGIGIAKIFRKPGRKIK